MLEPPSRQAYPCSDDRYPASIGASVIGSPISFRAVYDALLDPGIERNNASNLSLSLLRDALNSVVDKADDLPASPRDLPQWMASTSPSRKSTSS